MNTNPTTIRTLLRLAICQCAILLSLAACTGHDLPVVPSPGQGLRFAVPETAATRVTYNGLNTYFENNDTVGCIITIDGNYAANSAWHYCAETGMLIFDYIWGNKNNAWSRIRHDDPNNTILAHSGDNPEDGFIELLKQTNSTYNFYFYYPYVASDLLKEDLDAASNDYTKLAFPNICSINNAIPSDPYTQCFLTGEARETGAGGESWSYTFTNYTWTAYPCFVNHTQQTSAQINNSDFLWQCREGITSTSNQTINLRFQKKMANIEVDSDTRLTDVYFQATSDNALRRGKEINLSTGKITNYTKPANPWEGTLQEKNCYFTTTESILPYDNSNDAGTNYRLALPAQESFPCALHFTLNETPCKIDLSTQITRLDESTLYIIHITRKGETTLEIVDWENDHYEILDPDTDFQ